MAESFSEDESLVQEYLTESRELIQKVDEDLVLLESGDDPELVNRVFRALHTIKGTSSFFGFQQLVEIAHASEDILNLVRKGELRPRREMIDALLEATDQIKILLNDVASKCVREHELGPLLARLHAMQSAPAITTKNVVPKLGQVLLAEGAITYTELEQGLNEQAATGEPLGKVLLRKELVSQAQVEKALAVQAAAREGKSHDTGMRVEVHKLDELINLVGELVLERNRLQQLTVRLSETREWSEQLQDALTECSARLSLITEELQSASLNTRMVPIGTVFRRFPRIVRDVARNLGKDVELILTGESTELDKTVVEEIADPMVHLVRNALDHGIESPEVRLARGKPRSGTIQLDARQEGDQIVISIQDDGAGIDPERVLVKARERDLVPEERLRTMTKSEILELIFLPGFSTAEKVTDISGRGVGMDVVRSNMKKLNGAVELDSHIGLGSVITLRVPLTLAIVPVLLVRESENVYAVPLRCVIETVRLDRSRVHSVEGREVVKLRNRVLPLVRLSDVLRTGATAADSESLRVVIVAIGEQRMALLVDEFLGQEQTVVKPLGSYLGHVPGITGASIGGDGNVRLVIDPAGLISLLAAPLLETR